MAPKDASETAGRRVYALFGAAPDTGNLGVSALLHSALIALSERDRYTPLVFHHGRSTSSFVLDIPPHHVAGVLCGAPPTRRIYRRDSLFRVGRQAVSARGGSETAQLLRSAHAILDASGGDSFTDLYGPSRYKRISAPKRLAIALNKPLILLPQTFGPFNRSARSARAVLAKAKLSFARDSASFHSLEELLGDDFDPTRHRCGTDMAFGLPESPPEDWLEPGVIELLDHRRPVVGLNVSGLLLRDPRSAAAQFGLKVDYRRLVLELIGRFADDTDAEVLLVPHVVTPSSQRESDSWAIRHVVEILSPSTRERVTLLSDPPSPSAVKGVISRLEWFAGSRLHSTIAALSSGVPAAALAYSSKAMGVFSDCGVADAVVDMRTLGTVDAVDHVWNAWLHRAVARDTLQATMPDVLRRHADQFDAITEVIGEEQ